MSPDILARSLGTLNKIINNINNYTLFPKRKNNYGNTESCEGFGAFSITCNFQPYKTGMHYENETITKEAMLYISFPRHAFKVHMS